MGVYMVCRADEYQEISVGCAFLCFGAIGETHAGDAAARAPFAGFFASWKGAVRGRLQVAARFDECFAVVGKSPAVYPFGHLMCCNVSCSAKRRRGGVSYRISARHEDCKCICCLYRLYLEDALAFPFSGVLSLSRLDTMGMGSGRLSAAPGNHRPLHNECPASPAYSGGVVLVYHYPCAGNRNHTGQ